MKILFAASEAAPFVKTGGLGDVAGALPNELSKIEGAEVVVFLPYYKNRNIQAEFVTSFGMPLAWRRLHVGLFRAQVVTKKKGKAAPQTVTYYFIDNEYYFGRENCYGYPDDGERFAYFSKAVLESLPYIGFFPDIIHCNDWQTGLIPLFLKAVYCQPEYQGIKTVFTIHNIEYQGKAGNDFLENVLGVSEEWRDVLSFDNCINCMKSAIVLCDSLTTVSKTYSYEMRHAFFAHGLESVLQQNDYKITGIVNGIDPSTCDPSKAGCVHVPYKAGEIDKKVQNKTYFQQKMGLPVDENIPLIGIVSRLVGHKGLDLIQYVAEEMMSLPMQLVVLGTGDQEYEDLFRYLAYSHPDKMSAHITFQPDLATEIYAAADLYLMPSKSEPCGLSQLIAMRYGAIPIVRETGGLVDTVPPLNVQTLEGAGFTFKGYNAHDMLGAVRRALDFYQQKDSRQKVVERIMKLDTSWKQPAQEYFRVFQNLLK